MNRKLSEWRKNRRKIDIWFALFAFAFSLMLTASLHIFYNGGTLENTYVTDFHFVDAVILILLVPFVYLGLNTASFLLKSFSGHFKKEERKYPIGLFPGCTFLFLVLWIPYLMSYWPGGIYADTVDSLNMALGKAQWDNHNPVLYTFLWKVIFGMTGAFSGEGEYPGLKFFTVFQMVLIAVVMAAFIAWCYRKGFHRIFVWMLVLATALCPLYPFYGISLWKDTLFSIAVFVFSVFLYHLFDDRKEDVSVIGLVVYGILMLLVIFLRNNGIYIATFCTALMTAVCVRLCKKAAVKLGGLSLAILVIALVIQGPVFDSCGFNINKTSESMGIPIQQTAYILATDGKLSEEDAEVLSKIMPFENWKLLYDPVVADTIKFDPSFDRSYFEENGGEFLKTYLHLVIQNPVKAVKGYMLSTMGFWDIRESSSIAYICNFHFGNAEYFMSDYFDYYMDFSFKEMVEPRKYLSAALFVWLLLFTVVICLSKHNYRGLIALLPTLGVWLTVMIATPVSFSFRYVYSLFLCMPLYLIIALRSYEEAPEK